MINTDTIQQEMEQEEQPNKVDDMSGEINPYKELIINNAEKNGAIDDTNGAMVDFEQHFELCPT